MPALTCEILVCGFAQQWRPGDRAGATLTETVARWRDFAPRRFPTPHPSWRNNAWLKQSPWFQRDLLPAPRHAVQRALEG